MATINPNGTNSDLSGLGGAVDSSGSFQGTTPAGVGGTGGSKTVSPVGMSSYSMPAAPTASSTVGTVSMPNYSAEGQGKLPAPTATGTPVVDPGPAIYGANGNQTLGDFQNWQSTEFNKNQLAGQAQYNSALGQMPYNTQINQANPYDQFVANPATPGSPSAAFNAPANAAAWQNSGLASQLANPSTGFAQSRPGQPDYGNQQLLFLMNALQRYGNGGQNQFGNSFSPLFTGQTNSSSNLNGLGNSNGNGGVQSGNNGTGGGTLGLAQLLPLLIGLAQRNPAAGSYGNLGVPTY